jgi:hypothetical protein
MAEVEASMRAIGSSPEMKGKGEGGGGRGGACVGAIGRGRAAGGGAMGRARFFSCCSLAAVLSVSC